MGVLLQSHKISKYFIMVYTHNNYALETRDKGKASFYEGGWLRFRGDGYVAMKMFIHACNDPSVTRKFKKQLEMREQLKWKVAKEKENENSQ